MARYRPRITSMPIGQDGTSYNFYDPDIRLSQQIAQTQGKTAGATPYPKKAMYQEIATRETAWNYYRVLGFLPNPEPILRKMNKDVDEFRSLLSDSRVKACYNSRRGGALSMEWSIEQGDAQTRVFTAVEEMMSGWNIREIIADLCNACWYGYQPAEVLWKKEGSLVVASNLVTKDVSWFRYSDINELRYLTKRNMITGEPVPPHKFVVARHHPSYWNPYGESLAAACYWPVKFKHSGFRFWTTFVERYAMPYVQVNYPLGAQEARIREMVDTISNTVQDGVIAFPDNMKASTLNMNDTASSAIYKEFVDMCNIDVAMSILGQNLTTEVNGGSYAAANAHMGVRDDLINEDVKMLEDTINTVIKWFVEINWGPGKECPEFRLSPKTSATLQDAQMTVQLKNAGVQFKKEYFQSRFGLDEDEFDMSAPMKLGPNGMPIPGETVVPDGEAGEDGKDGAPGADVAAISEATDEAKDPSVNSSTYDAVKSVRKGKAY